ncbi:MAG: ATP-binding protein [Deltaproteobacteria bacterium]|nr:ATP-binding protein [Deltaproteobacteria bacterium]
MKGNNLLTTRQTFKQIIDGNMIYVDKTACLANMIERNRKTWFLARPRRFGKSLTVSTLESIFTGQKHLFIDLAIEKKLDLPLFAPRPVIHLDMSSLSTSKGLDDFDKSLRLTTADVAMDHGLELPRDLPASYMFSKLIKGCQQKYDRQVAVLIDEYDTPITDLFDEPVEAEKVRKVLREYYRQLKVCDQYISFVFVTGITKFVQGGLYSAFNNPVDISMDTQYGVLTGFTHKEIKHYFNYQLKEVAKSLKITKTKLLDMMKEYYNGFCFDGKTLVYNPHSILLFFDAKVFANFWFNSGTPDQLISFMRQKHLTVDKFRGLKVLQDRLRNPRQERFQDPAVYLYQLGYLSLKSSPSDDVFILDYPNFEVLQSMSLLLLEDYFNDSNEASEMCFGVKQALSERDPAALVAQFNLLLSKFPYDYHQKKRDEFFYCPPILTLFFAMGLDIRAEQHGNWGRADFVVTYKAQNWIIEVKVSYNDTKDSQLAAGALTQIKEKNYGGGCQNPVLLGIVINDTTRLISTWECQGGLSAKPEVKEEKNDDDDAPKTSGPRSF